MVLLVSRHQLLHHVISIGRWRLECIEIYAKDRWSNNWGCKKIIQHSFMWKIQSEPLALFNISVRICELNCQESRSFLSPILKIRCRKMISQYVQRRSVDSRRLVCKRDMQPLPTSLLFHFPPASSLLMPAERHTAMQWGPRKWLTEYIFIIFSKRCGTRPVLNHALHS